MAQINISHFSSITTDQSIAFSLRARDIVAKHIHGLPAAEIQANSVSVLVIPIDSHASLSGADSELQIQISGNDWPINADNQPVSAAQAKHTFDELAAAIHSALSLGNQRKIYVWVTGFTASGWSEE